MIKNRFAQPIHAITPLDKVVGTSVEVISPPAWVNVVIRIAKVIPIRRTLIQVKLAVQRRAFFETDHASIRPRCVLINSAAIGRLPIPINEAKSCRLCLILNAAAIASSIPDAIRKYKPILPAVVVTSLYISVAALAGLIKRINEGINHLVMVRSILTH